MSAAQSSDRAVKRGGTNAKKKPSAIDSVESTISTMSQADYATASQTLLIFDWDDTLCPSHWIRCNRPALQFFSPCPNDPRYTKPLGEVAAITASILDAASQLGHVVILTNAQVNWVQTSCRNFMPSLVPVLQKLKPSICYARAKFEQDLASPGKPQSYEYNYNMNSPQRWKEEAFKGEIAKFYSKYEMQSWKNIISVGDQVCEHDAAKLTVRNRPQLLKKRKCRLKTIKLLEDPSIEDMTAQLHVIHSWLQGIVRYDGNLDVDLGEDDDTIFELHERLIQDTT